MQNIRMSEKIGADEFITVQVIQLIHSRCQLHLNVVESTLRPKHRTDVTITLNIDKPRAVRNPIEQIS